MSRSSSAHRVVVRLLAGMQVLLLACSTYVLVEANIVPPPQRDLHVERLAAAYAEPTVVDDAEQVQGIGGRTEERASRAERQQPVYQARSAVPPDPKRAALSWPVGGVVTSRFGERVKPEDDETKEFHHGVDIGCREGWAIRAANSGRVVAVGEGKGYGYAVMLDHGNGYMTLYAHLSEFSVAYRGTVRRGQVLGACGETGRATGAHLHFEVRYGGYVWDPLTFLP